MNIQSAWLAQKTASLLPSTVAVACIPHLLYSTCAPDPYVCAEYAPGILMKCYGCGDILDCYSSGCCF
jgi:hypothetical protein